MGYDASVCILQGLRFKVDSESLDRDLKFLEIFDPVFYEQLILSCRGSEAEINDNFYCDLNTDVLANGYYFVENKNYLYIGVFVHCYQVVRSNDGQVTISLPSEENVNKFKQLCTDNNIDISSFNTYLFTID